MSSASPPPVLILGAGINGAALARDLALNGVPVWVVDANDIAFGATAKSSRLIHGGLRYLEYGDFPLVRESLAERARLRRLAPQFVEPLRLYIPVAHRTGSFWRSVTRLFGAARSSFLSRLALPGRRERGLWLVRMGLWLYDRFARDPEFPRSSVVRVGTPGTPQVDRSKYRWLCAYSDGQMRYPERFVVALLEDARRMAVERGIEFRVLTYHRATLADGAAEIRRCEPPHAERADDSGVVERFRPPLVVNATGAWGDLTLQQLHVPAPTLFGGTKGSHFITYHAGLKQALSSDGVYAEAADGRLVFVLPFGAGVLVGTTDERFSGPPEAAVASEPELDYLVGMINALFPQVGLGRSDVELHYSGVRPLPAVEARRTGAIPRDHRIEPHEKNGIPVLTLVGGKLTTCRQVAEELADEVLGRLGRERIADTRERPVSGGEEFPQDPASLRQEWERIAVETGFSTEQVEAVWSLCGRSAAAILGGADPADRESLAGTDLPLAFVRSVIDREWVATLADLVERRLMLVYQPGLTRQALEQLGDCLVAAGTYQPSRRAAELACTIERLHRHYGKRIIE
ncbi:MAG TPA: glycerol-3-phosphate dehydrogenase/oxidase [Planctomycetaceae bacterium]|nr:glycerol-3-phosphate dehydrogenase/oxidase [Planctomycetaceae bacterium]